VARSVAVLSLCAIIASSTTRASVVPASSMNAGAGDHAHAVVYGQRLVFGQPTRVDVAQVLAEHEGLVRTGREQEDVRPVRDAGEGAALADVDQVALGPWQRQVAPECDAEVAAGVLLLARAAIIVRGRQRGVGHCGCREHRGSGSEREERPALHDFLPASSATNAFPITQIVRISDPGLEPAGDLPSVGFKGVGILMSGSGYPRSEPTFP
jgi:hypothetical protein